MRQQLNDSNETISEQQKQIEAREATIKMLKGKEHGRLSTAPWKESTTKIEYPSIGPGIKIIPRLLGQGEIKNMVLCVHCLCKHLVSSHCI